MTNADTKSTSPLDALATEADTLAAGAPTGEAANDNTMAPTDAEAQQAEQGMRMMEAVAVKLMHSGLKFARKGIARGLPEIELTWSDSVLMGPSQAALPLVKKHLGKLMETAAASPELAVLLMGLLPLALGVVEAVELHERNRPRETAPEPSPAPPPPEGGE